MKPGKTRWPRSGQRKTEGVIFALGTALARQTHTVPQQDPGAEPTGWYPCLGLSHAVGATHPGSSSVTTGSTLPKPMNSASHKLEALVHTHSRATNDNISTKVSEREINFKQKPKTRKAGNWASLASTRFRGQLLYEHSTLLGNVVRNPGGSGDRVLYLSHVQTASTGTLLGCHLHMSHFVKN